jgi:hypothetical protein
MGPLTTGYLEEVARGLLVTPRASTVIHRFAADDVRATERPSTSGATR